MISYNELIKAHREYNYQSNKTYELVSSIKDVWNEIDSIINFVRIWNKRVPIGKNKDKIKEAILNLRNEFDFFKDYCIENLEFTQENIDIIKKIFDKLSGTVLKYTGTTKLMHGMNPNLFVMWDKGICFQYGVYPNFAGYINFMKLMQEQARELLKEHNKEEIIKETDRTLPKLIDEYNWVNFRTSKSIKNNK